MRRLMIPLIATLLPAFAYAQQATTPVKIGVLTDLSGVASDDSGPGSVEAAKMAIEDYGGKALGMPIEMVSANHQNKPDVAASIARQWYQSEGVDAIVDLTVSSVALAVQDLAKTLGKVTMVTGSGSPDLINSACSETGLVWTFTTTAYARPPVQVLLKDEKKKWFIMSVDYAFGKGLEKDASEALKAGGGTVLDAVRFPFDTTDFSSYLVQAQSNGADVVALGAGGGILVTWAKQTAEFGLREQGLTLAPLSMTVRSSHSIGLDIGQGMTFSSAYYWDEDDQTRAFATEFKKRMGVPPTEMQAGVYSAVTNYLKAVDAIGNKDGKATVAKMKEGPVEDFFSRNGRIRADGLLVKDFYVYQMKTPAESKDEWDLWKRVAKVPGEEAYAPLSDSTCPLVK